MSNNIKIINPSEEFIEAAAEIAAQAWVGIRKVNREILGEDIYKLLHNDWQEAKKNTVRNALKEGKGFIALCDNKVLGFTTYQIKEDLKIGEILNNAVSPDARGLGIAGLLNSALIKLFKEKGCIAAMVSTGLDEGHAPARKAYEKLGFKKNLPQVEYYISLTENYKEEDPGDLKILPFSDEHTEKLLEIGYDAWEAIHEAYKECLGEKLYYIAKPNWKENFRKSLLKATKESNFFVAELNGEIHGFCSYKKILDGKMGVFGYNGVSRNSRGMGIASKMYNFIKKELVKEGCLYARVHTGLDDGHAPARKAYLKTGFSHPMPMVTYYMTI